MSVVGIIPSRWSSSRFPGKPLVDLLGKSLIRRTYENAKQCKGLDRLVIATDDLRIAAHAKAFGAEVLMTSCDCLNGTERVLEAVDQRFSDAEIVVNIQGDEPCLDPKVVDTLIDSLKSTPEAVLTTPVTLIVDSRELFSSSTVKCVFDKNGRALYFSRAPIPFAQSSKSLGSYYRHLGIYCFRRKFLQQLVLLDATPLQRSEDLEQLKILENGFPIHVCVVENQMIGVDTPADLKTLKDILCQKENTSLLQEASSPL